MNDQAKAERIARALGWKHQRETRIYPCLGWRRAGIFLGNSQLFTYLASPEGEREMREWLKKRGYSVEDRPNDTVWLRKPNPDGTSSISTGPFDTPADAILWAIEQEVP